MSIAVRVFIVLSSISAIVMIIAVNHPNREGLSFGHVMTRAGTGVLLFAIAYGTAESAAMHIPTGTRLYVIAGGLVWLNVGLVASLREQHRKRSEDRKRRHLFHKKGA